MREIAHVELARTTRAVFVQGSYAYTASGRSGMGVVDVSDPPNPRFYSYTKTPGYATDVHVTGSVAYVTNNVHGLRVIDVSNPLRAHEIAHLEIPGLSYGVFSTEKYVYVVSLEEGD